MTAKEQRLHDLKESCTKDILSRDDLKSAKAALRKLEDRYTRLSRAALNASSPDVSLIVKRHRDQISYTEMKEDEVTYRALSRLGIILAPGGYLVVGYIKKDILLAVETLKHSGKYAEVIDAAEAVIAPLIEEEAFICECRRHIEEGAAYLKGNTAEQFFKRAAASSEITEAKRKAFRAFTATLKGWKRTEITDGRIFVNGRPVEVGTTVGVMIGSGHRVHLMKIGIGEDKETGKKFIALSNHTQWRQSSLVVLDTADKIPSDVLSEV